MKDLNFNLLRIFIHVATSTSFLDASRKLYISQPAISKSIKLLEEELGVSLFYRGNKGVNLTPDGEILLKYVMEAYNILLAGERMLCKNNELTSGSLIIGAQSHITRYYLLEKIEKFRKKYPGISIRVIDLSTRDLLEALEKHTVDFVIDSSPIDTIYNNTIVEPVAYLNTCFIESAVNKREIKDIKSMAKEQIILPLERSSLRKTLEKELKADNIVLKPVLEYETEELIIESVKRNIGIGFIVENAARDLIELNLVKKVNLDYDLPQVEVNLVYVENYLPNIAKIFIEECIRDKEGK